MAVRAKAGIDGFDEFGTARAARGGDVRIARSAFGLLACLHRRRADERPHQHALPALFVLHAPGLRPGAAEPEPPPPGSAPNPRDHPVPLPGSPAPPPTA